MKKKWVASTLVGAALLGSISMGALAATKLNLLFNNKKQNVDVRVINNKPYVPLSSITSLFGGKVSYDSKSHTYKVTSKDYHPTSTTSAKSYTVNVAKTTGPMEIKVTKISVNPAYKQDPYSSPIKAIVMDTQVFNNGSNKVNWYPTQGTFAFNTGEQHDDSVVYSSELDGLFLGHAYKKGELVIKVNGSLDSVNSVHFHIDGPTNDNVDSLGSDLDFTLKFR